MSMFKKAISATKQFSQNVSTAVVGCALGSFVSLNYLKDFSYVNFD